MGLLEYFFIGLVLLPGIIIVLEDRRMKNQKSEEKRP